MTEAASRARVDTFVGVQARAAPPIVHAWALIEQGYVARVTSAAMHGSYGYWGNPASSTGYSADVLTGATALTIPGGHGLDMLTFLFGEVASLSARETHLRDQAMAADEGRLIAITAPDQFACVGDLKSGALFSAISLGPHRVVYDYRRSCTRYTEIPCSISRGGSSSQRPARPRHFLYEGATPVNREKESAKRVSRGLGRSAGMAFSFPRFLDAQSLK